MKKYFYLLITFLAIGFTQCKGEEEISPKDSAELNSPESQGNDIVVRKKPG